jgi:hypothetical protein
MAAGIRRPDHVAPSYLQNLTLISPTSGGRSVGIVRSWTHVTEFLAICHINSLLRRWSKVTSDKELLVEKPEEGCDDEEDSVVPRT